GRRLRLSSRGTRAVRARCARHRAHPGPVRTGPHPSARLAADHARTPGPWRRHAGPARRRAFRCYCCGCGRAVHPSGVADAAGDGRPSDRTRRRVQPAACAHRTHGRRQLEAHRARSRSLRPAQGRNSILSYQEKHMLNGQLPLTELSYPAVRAARSPRTARLAGMFSLALLAGCSCNKTRAPVVDLSNQPPASVQPGGTYVVKPGDTLYQIARAHNLEIDEIKRWNNINDANQLSVGQVLKLSGSAAGASTPSATPTTPTTPAAPAEPKPVPLDQPEPPAATTPPAEAPATVPTPPRASDASLISWGWPASGPILQAFSSSTKGIDIGGSLGDPVAAAADGKVMYSGN